MSFTRIACISVGLFLSSALSAGPRVSLEQSIGKTITVQGEAVNSKAGAAVLTGDKDLIFIDDMPSWGRDAGKRLEVSGILRQRKLVPDAQWDPTGAVSQGAEGLQYVFDHVRWKFLDIKNSRP